VGPVGGQSVIAVRCMAARESVLGARAVRGGGELCTFWNIGQNQMGLIWVIVRRSGTRGHFSVGAHVHSQSWSLGILDI